MAKDFNFRNSDPPASFKTARINSMKEATEANNQMGTDLVNEAEEFLAEAQTSFDGLAEKRDILDQTFTDSNDRLEKERYDCTFKGIEAVVLGDFCRCFQ